MRKCVMFPKALSVCLYFIAGCGGGGSSDGTASTDFTGQYQGLMNRVINECQISFDWDGVYLVEHEGDSLILQVGDRYPKRYAAVVTSPNSFTVTNPAETSGACTSQSRYDFSEITESSAVVRWTVDYSKGCFLAPSSSACTVAFEGVLPRQ